MRDFIAIRIYFENGQKIQDQSFWIKIFSSDFSMELMKRAKAFGLQQVLHLNVTKGYLDSQKVYWGISEVQHYKQPQIIEIIDSELKINQFLEEQKNLLQATSIFLVKNEILIK